MENLLNETTFEEHIASYLADIYPFEWPMLIDTIKTTTNLCRLPACGGRCGYK